MYSSIDVPPVPASLATADPSLPLLLQLRHIIFIRTEGGGGGGGGGGDVQGEAGSRLRIAHANFY